MDECVASEKTRGKPSGYVHHKCRCWKCATADYVRHSQRQRDDGARRALLQREYYARNIEAERQRQRARYRSLSSTERLMWNLKNTWARRERKTRMEGNIDGS